MGTKAINKATGSIFIDGEYVGEMCGVVDITPTLEKESPLIVCRYFEKITVTITIDNYVLLVRQDKTLKQRFDKNRRMYRRWKRNRRR